MLTENAEIIDSHPADGDNASSETKMISVGAVMRNDTIEKALSVASTIREQQQQNQQDTTSATSEMHDALLKRLEGRLLANEMECTKLQELAVAWKGTYLVETVEALMLVEKEDCIKISILIEKTRKRGTEIQNLKDSMTASAGPLPNVVSQPSLPLPTA
jgi:hypothetical protein